LSPIDINSINQEEHVIEADILSELPSFEAFFSRIGFKRIDGSVFGLLALSKKPLTSEEIESTLHLSQSAVSLSLKTLSHFGAIETIIDRDHPGVKSKLHFAKVDSLSIVASVFRKREEEVIADFKRMALRVLTKTNDPADSMRKRRLLSIVSTCEMAESVMSFVITMTQNKNRVDASGAYDAQYEALIKNFPKALDLLSQKAAPLADFTLAFKDNITEKFKNNFKGFYEK
jgi:DNA-binding transcriptional regulator GbsR (MarR family)